MSEHDDINKRRYLEQNNIFVTVLKIFRYAFTDRSYDIKLQQTDSLGHKT